MPHQSHTHTHTQTHTHTHTNKHTHTHTQPKFTSSFLLYGFILSSVFLSPKSAYRFRLLAARFKVPSSSHLPILHTFHIPLLHFFNKLYITMSATELSNTSIALNKTRSSSEFFQAVSSSVSGLC